MANDMAPNSSVTHKHIAQPRPSFTIKMILTISGEENNSNGIS